MLGRGDPRGRQEASGRQEACKHWAKAVFSGRQEGVRDDLRTRQGLKGGRPRESAPAEVAPLTDFWLLRTRYISVPSDAMAGDHKRVKLPVYAKPFVGMLLGRIREKRHYAYRDHESSRQTHCG